MWFYSSTAGKTIKCCIHKIRCILFCVKVTSNKASKALSYSESWLPKRQHPLSFTHLPWKQLMFIPSELMQSLAGVGLRECSRAMGPLWHTHTESRFCSLCLQEILGFHILALSLWPVSHCTAGGCWVLLRCSLRWSSYLAAQKMLMPCWLLALCTSWNKSLQATERKCHMVIALETRGPCQHWLDEQHFLWCRVIDTEPWRRLNPQVRETAG